MKELPFHLLVAGELEIITSRHISHKEKQTRLEVLKKLAYKSEFLNLQDVIAQYVNFLQEVEKGKFKWGNEDSLQAFEQQLVNNVSVNRSHTIWDHQKWRTHVKNLKLLLPCKNARNTVPITTGGIVRWMLHMRVN